jgi:hypothetical protein
MGNAFDFDPDFIQNFWKLGYLDTKRTFGELIGYRYFVEPDFEAEQDWNAAAYDEVKRYYHADMRHDKRHRLRTLETCATLLSVDRIQQYSYASLTEAICAKAQATEKEVQCVVNERGLDKKSSSSKLLDAFTREILDDKKRDDNPYFYLKLIQHFESTTALKLAEKGVRRLNPELAILEKFLLACDSAIK